MTGTCQHGHRVTVTQTFDQRQDRGGVYAVETGWECEGCDDCCQQMRAAHDQWYKRRDAWIKAINQSHSKAKT